MTKDKEKLVSYLKSQRLMSLATCNKKPWASTVLFVTDDELNFYFISDPTAKHCRDIEKNPLVACTIADSHQKVTDKKIGVQLQGVANPVTGKKLLQTLLKLWNKANPGFEKIINFENLKHINSKVYKIKPQMIKFFNEKMYGTEGVKIFRPS